MTTPSEPVPPHDEPTVKETEASLLQRITAIENRIKEIEMEQATPPVIPPCLRAKLHALRKVQLDIIDREVKFHLNAHEMEIAFQPEFNECHETIARIVQGLEVPELQEPEATTNDVADQPKGVPDFWLTVLKATFLYGIIHEADEPALKQLQDIRCVLLKEPEPGFMLEFHFAPNDYFTNAVLTKQYLLQCAPDTEEPAKFNGFEINRCIGCTIDWKPDQCLTKDPPCFEECNSFFYFFEPETLAQCNVDEEYNVSMMQCDFQYGYYIKDTIIPRAVFLFLGESPCLGSQCDNVCCCDRSMYMDCLKDFTTLQTALYGETECQQPADEAEDDVPETVAEGQDTVDV